MLLKWSLKGTFRDAELQSIWLRVICTQLEAGTQQSSHDEVGSLRLSLTHIHFQLLLIREMISLSQHWRWNILSLKYLDHVFPFQKKMPCCKSTSSRGRCLSILAGSQDKTFLFLKGKLNPASMSGPSLYSDVLRCSGNEKPCSYLLRSSQYSPIISTFQKSYTYTSSWHTRIHHLDELMCLAVEVERQTTHTCLMPHPNMGWLGISCFTCS